MTPVERRDITLDEFDRRIIKIMEENPERQNPVENGKTVYTTKTGQCCLISEYMKQYDPDLLPEKSGMHAPSASVIFSQAGYGKMVALRAGYYQTISDQYDYSTKIVYTWEEALLEIYPEYEVAG